VPKAEAAAAAKAAESARPLTNGDFAAGLDGWHAEAGGDSFRVLADGNGKVLTTAGGKKDADTGRLFQCFAVPADATELRFSLRGGADIGKTHVALWHGDRLYRRMGGRDGDRPFRVRWDVKPLRGEVVTLEVVDGSTAPGGFIAVQGFELVRAK
jgi:hypothetical protein